MASQNIEEILHEQGETGALLRVTVKQDARAAISNICLAWKATKAYDLVADAHHYAHTCADGNVCAANSYTRIDDNSHLNANDSCGRLRNAHLGGRHNQRLMD